MKLILKYVKRYWPFVLLNLVGVLGFAAAELGLPTIMASIIDQGIARLDMDYVYRMGGYLLLAAVLGGAGNVLIAYCSSYISTHITRDLRNDIFAKTLTYSHEEYRRFGVASMITRTTNDAFQLMQFVNMLLRVAMLTPVMIIISVTLTMRTSLDLSMVIGLTVPFILLGVALIAKFSGPISTRQQTEMDDINRVARENLTGIRVIRAFRREEHESLRFRLANRLYTQDSKKLFKLMSIAFPAFFLLLNISILFVFWIAGQMIDLGSLQVGQLVAFMEYQFHAMFSMLLFCTVFVMYPRAAVSARRIQELLQAEPKIHNPAQGVTETLKRSLVEFDNVSFRYPDGEAEVISGLSFTASAGETVAFIGSTGSGKSTLIHLIPRFYDVTGGAVRVGGVDVREQDLSSLRAKISLISQKAQLFSGSIADNIRMGRAGASMQEIEYAAQVAQAENFISGKPAGYDEPVSEGGTNLSGGQKQRLSIARALVRKPEIYIFDDSFSALDFKTDAALRKRLADETRDAVMLVVAQRVSTVMEATRIIVLEEGRMVGCGTHRELLKSCPIYYEIASSQLTEEELANA